MPSRYSYGFWSLGATMLLASAAGTGWVLSQSSSASADFAGAAVAEAPALVCYGHVDVAGGVQALAPAQTGRVAAVLVRENQGVEAGAVLVRLEDQPARLRLAEAEAMLQAAEARMAELRKLPRRHQARIAQQQAVIDSVRHQLTAANQVLIRKRKLAQIQQASPEDVTAAVEFVQQLEARDRAEEARLDELRLHDPEAEIRQAESELAAARARRDQAKYSLDQCSLRAPCAGTVLRIHVAPGDLLGEQQPRPVIEFCPAGPRLVRAEVTQEFADQLRLGQSARIENDVHPGQTWRGRVTQISGWYTHRRSVLQEPFERNDVRTLECLITLDPDQPPLRIGQRMRVVIDSLVSSVDP